ncbi:hypothetical protein LEP1GSC151_0455 [Leptospira interrogans serovar Grippotyphosa str. LT2186]|uniref:Uncharacterized protein n=1 Tax=Leptospira interrogans serovar Grippotyphosa str. LT2186 TaxID=1001599 RepID=M3I443_LEPIR|nr:hypothetical protein LEP1GSC151_0455 [Leptospira interrogans serovar Grippotyphosa str. LT2186]
MNWDPEETLLPENIKEETELSKLEFIIQDWKKFRMNYPGWIIAPDDIRAKLLRSTVSYIHYISNNHYENISLQFAICL